MSAFITAADLNRITQLEQQLQGSLNNRINSCEMKINNLRAMESYMEQKIVDLARVEDHLRSEVKRLELLTEKLEQKLKPENVWQDMDFSLTDLYCEESTPTCWMDPDYLSSQSMDLTEIEELLK
jgi:DNA repair exonuclease SbcCD ATPase subunit